MNAKGPAPDGRRAREAAEAARAARRRRFLAYGVPAALVVLVTAVAIVATLQSRAGGKPAAAGEVEVASGALSDPLAVGSPVPDFSAPGLAGGRVAWRDVKGAPAVLVVWASWCPHCQRELPILARVAPAFPGVRVLTVTTAVGAHPGPSPEEFVRKEGLPFPVAVDDGQGRVARALGVRSFPTLYWVAADGRVRAVTQGERGEAALRAAFETLSSG